MTSIIVSANIIICQELNIPPIFHTLQTYEQFGGSHLPLHLDSHNRTCHTPLVCKKYRENFNTFDAVSASKISN